MTACASFLAGLRANRSGGGNAVASVCSAHPDAWRALFRTALRYERFALIESTSNQVNRRGGYTGMTPSDFVRAVHRVAEEEGFPPDRLLLGGDHLGPNFGGRLPAAAAMDEACLMASDYVRSGYRKIHLDTSFVCADDPAPPPDEITARRSAQMAAACEKAASGGPPPLYIIGTEVPTPGGMADFMPEEMTDSASAGTADFSAGKRTQPTRPGDAARTLDVFQEVFRRNGLEDVLDRVVGLVVEAGVKFGDGGVIPYRPTPDLAAFIRRQSGMVFEAHSTDYQAVPELKAMAAHHFYILKVGPWLSFALREGIFGLELIERELAPERPSRFRETLLRIMREDPRHWKAYFPADAPDRRLFFSYSDRCRYYLGAAEVRKSVERLWENLNTRIPEDLLSQYLSRQWDRMKKGTPEGNPTREDQLRTGRLPDTASPRDLAVDAAAFVLEGYFEAGSPSSPSGRRA
ncbi:MAG: tagatose-bisphosphate aldolase [Desulfobacterales bacterium]|nr:MAG: tagatose-bisphosphate aldolase [Desulfobacterales bacterium]